jgi:hypothetical protein
MIYKHYSNEYVLPRRDLGLYSVDKFVFEMQSGRQIVGRSPSARFTRNQQPQYQGADATSVGLAYTDFIGFEQAGPSHQMTQPWSYHTTWEGHTTY